MGTDLVPLTGTEVVGPALPTDFEKTASWMAEEYAGATAEIARLMLAIKAQGQRLHEAFRRPGDGDSYPQFGIEFEYNGRRHRGDDPGPILGEMKRRAWRTLVDQLGVKNVMSVAKRKQFDDQLERGELPEINRDTILDILFSLAGQAQDFAKEAAAEVFDILRPRGGWGGQYKTNDAFRVGRKVILIWMVERCWDNKKFRVIYGHEQKVTAIDGVFHLLDGKGVMRDNKGPLIKAIAESPDGRGETTYFKFKCFKNRNLHLEMKRLDLVQQLNLLASGEYVLGDDMKE